MTKFEMKIHNHSVSLLLAHFVITTKYRRPTLTEQYNLAFFQQIIDKHSKNITIHQTEIGEDFAHLHLLVQFSSNITFAKVAQIIKGCSSKAIKDTNPNFDGWSVGYYVSSTGGAGLEAVQAYIANQRT